MNIQIISKKVKDLSKKEIDFINSFRVKDSGEKARLDFKKVDRKGEFIFVKENGRTMAHGMMKPVKVKLNGKEYSIFGMGRGRAIIKKRGYGRLLNSARLFKLSRAGKTGIAFTARHNIGFFQKVGFKIEKNGIRKFAYKNPKTKKLVYDNDGDMVYYEGKDKFVTKLLNSKNKAITDTDFW
jgi:predicted N-acetyltransferase YhbS